MNNDIRAELDRIHEILARRDRQAQFNMLMAVAMALACMFIGTWIGWMAAYFYYFPL
jgi:hypothetical protein